MEFFDDYNKQVLALADNERFKSQFKGRVPQQLTQKCVPNKLVLVVGMNPSFDINWISKQINQEEKYVNELFSLDINERVVRLKEIRKFEEDAIEKHPYFDRVRDLSVACGFKDDWNHIDLFVMRETSQKEALKAVGYKEIKEDAFVKADLNDYGNAQLLLFEWAVNILKPKIIIVANTAASVIVSDRFNGGENNSSFDFNNITKVFLSGMLGGQRALDRYSRLRLIKEIKEHLKLT
jgi:hypothetical protein